MDNMGYLLAAYTIIWAVIFGYVLFMQRKQRKLQMQVTLLQKSIEKQKTNNHAQPGS